MNRFASTFSCLAPIALLLACGPSEYQLHSGTYIADASAANEEVFRNLTLVVDKEAGTAVLTPGTGSPINLTFSGVVMTDQPRQFDFARLHQVVLTPNPISVNGQTISSPILTPVASETRQVTIFGRNQEGSVSPSILFVTGED